MTEKCQKCGEEGDDRRTLWMSCLYDMKELEIPFETQMMLNPDAHEFGNKQEFYIIRVCKECRARWMHMIRTWFKFDFKRDSPGTGIFVRDLGGHFEVTEEEWREKHGNLPPVRVKKDG